MQKFIIERHVPGAGDLTAEKLREIATTSNAAVASLRVPYHWHESFAAGDTIYSAELADVIYEHARRGGFPADKVTAVGGTFGPETASA